MTESKAETQRTEKAAAAYGTAASINPAGELGH